MNSQSYACPELLGPDADGLSSSGRATATVKEQENSIPIELIGGDTDFEKMDEHHGREFQPNTIRRTYSPPASRTSLPRPYRPYAPLPPTSEIRHKHHSRRRQQPIHGSDERGEIVYVAQICLCDEGFEVYIDDADDSNKPHLHRHCTPFSWDCSHCYAFLKDGRDGAEWEDGVCWNCGVLNRKVPEVVVGGGGKGMATGEPGRRERMKERCVVM